MGTTMALQQAQQARQMGEVPPKSAPSADYQPKRGKMGNVIQKVASGQGSNSDKYQLSKHPDQVAYQMRLGLTPGNNMANYRQTGGGLQATPEQKLMIQQANSQRTGMGGPPQGGPGMGGLQQPIPGQLPQQPQGGMGMPPAQGMAPPPGQQQQLSAPPQNQAAMDPQTQMRVMQMLRGGGTAPMPQGQQAPMSQAPAM